MSAIPAPNQLQSRSQVRHSRAANTMPKPIAQPAAKAGVVRKHTAMPTSSPAHSNHTGQLRSKSGEPVSPSELARVELDLRTVGGELSPTAGILDDGFGFASLSKPDGSFAFETVPNFGAWVLGGEAPEPLADVHLAGIEVTAGECTDLGVVYLTPSFAVEGIVVTEDGTPIADASVRAVRRPIGTMAVDLLQAIRDIPHEPVAVDSAADSDSQCFSAWATRVVVTRGPPRSAMTGKAARRTSSTVDSTR